MSRPYSYFLAAIIGLHLLIGLVYNWATPILEASDEGFHFAAIRWIALGNGLPIQRVGEERDWEQEGSQPPLYYWISAGLTALAGTGDYGEVFVRNPLSRVGVPGTTHNVNLYRHPLSGAPLTGTVLAVKLIRWFSILLSAGTVFLTAQLARRVFPGNEPLALLAAALVAFNPMALFINASVNNDNLLILLSTASVLVTVQLMQAPASSLADSTLSGAERSRRAVIRRGGWGGEVVLGLLLGLAALTKVSGLVLWPIAALGMAWAEYRRWTTDDRRKPFVRLSSFFLRLTLIFGVALAVCGWWFLRNYQLYGEWLGLQTMIAVAGAREPAITVLQLIRQEWNGFWLSYWGVFGTFDILAAPWVYWIFDGLTLWAMAGGLWALWRKRPRLAPESLLLGLFILLTLLGLVRWTLGTFASQGRLMFGAVAPLSIFMAAGLLAPFPTLEFVRATRRVAPSGVWFLGLGAFLLVLLALIVPFAYIAPRYAPPPVLREFDLPGDLHEVHAMFGDGIELIGYTSDNTPRKPGESQPLTLYWRGLRAMNADYAVALHLLGQGGAEIGKIDTWPGGGNAPTTQWQAGVIFADSYLIPIDSGAAVPSLARLDLAFWDGDPANQLPATAPNGEKLASVTFTVGRVVPAQAPQFAPALAEGSTFEYGIALLGVDVSAGGAFTLYWMTEQPIPADYTVFVHLLDANGNQVAQADAPPLAGDWPTSAWAPGQPFADPRRFSLPTDLAPGRYTLNLGFYDPASGARLAAFRSDGAEWQDDIVVIEDAIEIK